MMEVCEVIYGFPDDTYPVLIEDCLNNNLDDITRNYLNEINEIGVVEWRGETKYIDT